MSLTIRKRGRYWYARGTIPSRQADGRIARVRIEESTRSESKSRAREIASDIERHYHSLAYNPKPKSISFAQAAITYIQTRGRSDKFVTALIKFFGDTPIAEIDQACLAQTAHTLWPGSTGSTHNRAVFSPVIAILRLSGMRTVFKRPRVTASELRIPDEAWFDAILTVCPPRLGALLVTLTLTGRRLGELIGLKPEDLIDGKVIIGKTKTGDAKCVRIPELAIELLSRPTPRDNNRSRRLFGYSDGTSARLALRKICKRHKLPYFGTHALGRHSFATRLLRAGWNVKAVADAGGWATPNLVMTRYGHLEQREVDEDVRKVGLEWSKKRTS